MRSFRLPAAVDFVFVMCGSLYATSTADILSHLNSVGDVLNSGGLYLLDWCINFEWCDPIRKDQRWTIERQGITIDVEFDMEIVDRAKQLVRHRLGAAVRDRGVTRRMESVDLVRVILPQEFLLLVEKSGRFEFVGWWNNWDLSAPVEDAQKIDRPIALIRRL
jgi:hypothetical protein